MKTVNFGVIGCGWMGGLHSEIIHSLGNTTLHAVSGTNEQAGLKLSSKYNCQYYKNYIDLLKDPLIDAVAICLPTGLHGTVTMEAAHFGKHIICEKPIEINTLNASKMIQSCHRAQVKLSIIMQHRFDEPILAVEKALSDGVLGKIILGVSRTLWYRDEHYFANAWRGTWAYDGGGALMNQSIHYIDLLLYLLGDVKSVSAKCRRLLHQQIEAEDVGIANLEFLSGSLGTIEGTTAAYPGEGSQLCLFAEKGTVIIKDDQLFSYHLKGDVKYPDFERLLGKQPQIHPSFGVDEGAHRRQYEDFVSSIINDHVPLVTGEEALKSLSVIKAIYEASDKKTEVYFTDHA